MSRLQETSMAYQAQLELLRSAENGLFDDDFIEDLREDLAKARGELEVAWLEHVAA